MTLHSTYSFFSAPGASISEPVATTEDARRALEHLLELGVQVVDGDVQALLKVPVTLAVAIQALDNVHALAGALPTGGGRHLRGVLARHAERRRRLDLLELDKLAAAVQAADQPQLVGRSMVIAALVLLSNLASDERWLGVVNATHHAV